jgi:hypothetical protein
MKITAKTVGAVLLSFSAQALAQPSGDTQTPPRGAAQGDDNRSVARPCDRLAGAAREQCLREERGSADRAAQGRELTGSCDELIGPEKDRCLQQGGTVEAGAKSSSGASSRTTGR